jgi:hypothetical protein
MRDVNHTQSCGIQRKPPRAHASMSIFREDRRKDRQFFD